MSARSVAAVMTLLAGTTVALAQPPAPPPVPRLSFDDSRLVAASEGGSMPTSLPPPGAPLWKGPDSPQFPDLGVEHDGSESSDAPFGCAGAPCGKSRPCRVWLSGEYLMWWFKDGPLQSALLTTSPSVGTTPIGSPGNTVLFGGRPLDFDFSSGGRVTVGVASPALKAGFEATGFMLQEQGIDFTAGSGGSPILSRPVINAGSGAESALLVAAPGNFAGTIDISASSKFYGAEANGVLSLFCVDMFAFDGLMGFRYLDLTEDVDIRQQTTVVGDVVPGQNNGLLLPRTSTTLAESFRASNQFYGGQIGGRAEYRRDNFFITITGKVAFGNTCQTVDTFGATTSPSGTAPGALLALSSNSGRIFQEKLTIIPEATANVGVQLTPGIRVFVGYTFIHWGEVARPGNFIDRRINPSLVPTSPTFGSGSGTPAPRSAFRHGDFWAQGISFGLALRY